MMLPKFRPVVVARSATVTTQLVRPAFTCAWVGGHTALLSRAEKPGVPPVAVTVMVAVRLPLASFVTATPMDKSASRVPAAAGLITPARGLGRATIGKEVA